MNPRIAFALLASLALTGCVGSGRDASRACAFDRKAQFAVRFARGLPLADAVIDGHPTTMMVDTGASGSLIARDASDRLKLRTDPTKVFQIEGIGGTSFEHPVTISSLTVGDLTLPERTLMVGPFKLPVLDGETPDGILGNDIMALYDVDLDLPHRRVTLYAARNCPGGGPPWQEAYDRVPTPYSAPGKAFAFVPATIDGYASVAILDSGAMATTVSRSFALSAGTTEASLDQDRSGTVLGASVSRTVSRLHRFDTMTVGAERFRNPRFVVTDLPQDISDMIIGEDFLRSRRVWISYLSRMVYIARPQRRPAATEAAPVQTPAAR
jgi:predicted aspartyl protease